MNSIEIQRGDDFIVIEADEIGSIAVDCGGSDQYILYTCNGDDITPDDIYNAVLPFVYRDTNTPGQYYCHRLRVMQTSRSNEVICVIEHRYDS
jgi:hypothetical protein